MESIKQIIPAVLRGFQNPKNKNREILWNEWPKIVGEKFAKSTRPSLTDKGTLFVWVNDSALGFEINQKYRQIWLKKIQTLIGNNEVRTLMVRVGELR